jgi:RimJ/RimL family protein N-acetyltransferase
MDLNLISRELDSKDFHLRPLAITDVETMFTMLSDTESMKYWSDPPISKLEEAVQVLMKDLDSDAKGNSMCWAVTRKGEHEMIGKVILFQFNVANGRAEIGYLLDRKFWRQGVMHQALGAVIEFAFNTLDLHRIEADVDSENIPSIGLLEKLGFEREGLFRDRWRVYDEWQDSVMLALINRTSK